ncbi:TPA: peptidase S10 [Candidatus Poribacteria bacterium]|nr:peptidase S10 [Candidatus Poribacteria bacterium]
MSEEGKGQPEDLPPEEPEDRLSITQHSVTIDQQEIHYTVTAGTIVLKEEQEKDSKSGGEKAKASVFFVAYTLDNAGDTTKRPITFSFNGGPGSSSVWLHLGVLGPRCVETDQQGNLLQPPYQLVENQYSVLDQTDLVFIDPISTGFSRVVQGEVAKQFHGFKKDIESIGDFIRLYTTRYQRWTSPKFLIGESYGTTRAAGLSGYLQERHGLYLNGIMLISSVLDFQTIRFMNGNDLPYILYLPSFTAAAWYHNLLDEGLQADLYQTLEEVEAFAVGEYTLALMKGVELPEDERQEITRKLAHYTGLPIDYIERTDLRINIIRFCKELLRDQGRTVGRFDSRFTGLDRDSAGERFEYDPSYTNILGPYTATLNDYLRSQLKFESDLAYEILTDRVHPWNYDTHQNQYVNVTDTLRKAMTTNPYLKVFVASGYYDLATPYMATRYTFNHLGLDKSLQQNVSISYYEAGHMMYVHQQSLIQLKEDLASFIQLANPL